MQFFKKKINQITLLFISIAVMFLYINPSFSAGTKSQIKQVEQKRSMLRNKINSLEKLERRQSSLITKNQRKLEKNKKELINSQKQLVYKQNNIKSLQKDLDDYLHKYNNKNAKLAQRLRSIYKTKHSFIFDLFIKSDSISQFLDRIYYYNVIIRTDKTKLDILRNEAKKITLLKKRVEDEKIQLSRLIKTIGRENSSIQNTINQNEAILKKIQQDKKAYEKSEKELAQQSNYLAKLISKNTKRSKVTGVQGAFILPVSGARISSPFGWRVHPIFKSKIFHTGIDYAIAYGTPIKASNSGKVIYSGWYGGYGKVVIIDHGSYNGAPTTTLYAHMSRQNVSAGQTVSKGDIIGYVGSTGYSTGPHVHFEVRINGKPQNPGKFL